ncbi:YfiR family protein [bacterium]|nr:YfiR family protein [bacterium]
MKRMPIILLSLLLSTAWLSADLCPAQDMPVPVDLQLNLLLKVITFNRNLASRGGDSLRLGIVYQEPFRNSLLVCEQIERVYRSLGTPLVKGLPLALAPIDIYREKLDEAVSQRGVDILYVAPLRAFDIRTIGELCRSRGIVSVTGVPEYCGQGLAVGIGQNRDRPEILINIRAAREDGADFSSQLLKLARVVQ